MLVRELNKLSDFVLLTEKETLSSKKIKNVYICDLLSWVLSHADEDFAWITVHTHINIVAVAVLLKLSCIIIPENIRVEKATIRKANEERIPILSTSLNSYEIARLLNSKNL